MFRVGGEIRGDGGMRGDLVRGGGIQRDRGDARGLCGDGRGRFSCQGKGFVLEMRRSGRKI